MVPAERGDPEGDAALVAAIAAGDRRALAELYDLYGGVLLALALRIVRDRREAEDLLHDVFLEVWRTARDYDPARGRVRTWLTIRMRSRALDQQKSARVSRHAGDDSILERVADDAGDPASSPDRARVRAALVALPTEQRQVLELAYFEGLSCSEIATRIAAPVGTVKSRVAAGLGKLRHSLGVPLAVGGPVVTDVRELLPLHALGLLDADEAAGVERAVAADPALAVELASYRDAAAAVGGALPSLEPSRAVWDRLLHSIGGGRFDGFAASIARLFDVSADRARELMGWIDDPARWETFAPGAWLIHFPAGPACAGADTGFVKVAPGARFPRHVHGGDEVTLVLQGASRDQDGRVLRAGDEHLEVAGSLHEFTAEPGEDFVFAVRVVDVRFDLTS